MASKRSIKLVEFKKGHTTSDVVLQLPKEGIVFMGDLFFVNRHPWLGDGDAASWHQHLQDLKENASLHKYVPGHGPVSGKAEIQLLQNYLKDHPTVSKNRGRTAFA